MQHHKEDLVARFTKGEVAAYNEVFNEYYHRILVFCKYLVPVEDAEDITANIFIRLWKQRKDLNSIANIKAFLFISARNACLNQLRELKAKAVREKEVAHFIAKDEQFIMLSEIESDVITRIKVEIEKLPDNCKQVFALSYFDGYKNPEIAQQLSISEKTVRNLKSIALKTIKAVMLNKDLQLNFFALLLCKFLLQLFSSSNGAATRWLD